MGEAQGGVAKGEALFCPPPPPPPGHMEPPSEEAVGSGLCKTRAHGRKGCPCVFPGQEGRGGVLSPPSGRWGSPALGPGDLEEAPAQREFHGQPRAEALAGIFWWTEQPWPQPAQLDCRLTQPPYRGPFVGVCVGGASACCWLVSKG